MRSKDSETEDISVDHNRVARDYALMRLEYIKFSTGNHLERCLEQIKEDFTNAQERLLSSLDTKNRIAEKKVSQVFDKVLKDVKIVIAGKTKKLVPSVPSKKSSPVTRLRRRASIEASENVSSPATPTKKKGGRLAAKPLLDNIDENAPVSSPKPTTQRSVARDNPVEEKTLTPARRSTRIRSNTSLTAETPQGIESPRAKRISRRHSLAGSDNEASVTTPVKQTRRPRKASTSSVDNGVEPTKEPDSKIPFEDALSNDENLSPNNVRKSARLMSKPPKFLAESPAVVKTKKPTRPTISPKPVSNGSESLQNGETSLTSEKPDLLNEINIISKDNTEKLSGLEQEKSANVKLSTSVETESQSTTNKSSTNISINDKFLKIQTDDSVDPNVTNDATTIPPLQNKSFNDPKDVTVSVNSAKPDALADMIVELNPNTVVCTVLFEDSNYGNCDKEIDNDQWVPVRTLETFSQLPLTTNASVNISQEKPRSTSTSSVLACEPMDIDETMPDNVSLTDHLNEFETSSLENNNSIRSKNKLSVSQSKDTSQLNETSKYSESPISEENKKIDNASVLSLSMEKKTNKSQTKLSLSKSVTTTNLEKEIETSQTNSPTLDKSKTKLSLSQSVTTTNLEKEMETSESKTPTLDKSKSKSSVSQSTSLIVASAKEDINMSATNAEKSGNISKRESTLPDLEKNKKISENKSLTQSESTQDLEKSTNENKSTLILSQIRDDETSITKSPKVTNISQQNVMETSLMVNESSKLKNISHIKSSENTPLKDKAVKTLGMQTSTPVISNNITKKGKQKNPLVENPKTAITHKKQTISDKSSENSESSDSDFMDDEAEDAGDDYESGDSRDDEQIRYEKENEIVERGETLDSVDEASNDSDYEKDSFVVSSDPEDQELLDGTGDDLNLSDNELTMSAKSKKKYNERKSKEQKEASKKMYESRRKNKSLYESSSSSEDEKSKPKNKNNRLRLDSSSDPLSQDDPVKSVKGKRMRIDSTFDDSSYYANANVSITKKKGLPNSSTDVINENEITAMCDESMFKKKDPLKVDVKLEPKTPQKDLDISTVYFSTHLPISEVQVNENVSMVGPNKTSDPLHDDEDDEDSLSSENQDIMNNYDSMLKNLNNSKQNKSLDSSKKNKKREKTIVDELNLTGTKSKAKATSKKEKKPETSDGFNDDESSSNSIDLKQLLLNSDNESDSEEDGPADFIPLKKAEAKTNIRTDNSIGKNAQKITLDVDEIDGQQNLEELLNISQNSTVSDKNNTLPTPTKIERDKKKKHKKSISSAHDSNQNKSAHENPTESKEKENNVSLSKRKENKSLLEPNEIAEETINNSEKGKKKKQANLDITENKDVSKQDITKSTELQDTSVSKKKKKDKKNKVAETDTNDEGLEYEPQHLLEQNTETTELQNTSLSKKKKKHNNNSVTETDTNDEYLQVLHETIESHSTSSSKKKKKHNNNSVTETDTNDEDLQVLHETIESHNTSSSKKKKKHTISLNKTKDTSFTKMNNETNSVAETDSFETELEALLTTLPTDVLSGAQEGSHKKKKNKSDANTTDTSKTVVPETESIGFSVETHLPEGSHKKKKNKSDANTTDTSKTVVPETESIGFTVETRLPEIYNSIDADVFTGKKRKRKSSGVTAEALEGVSSSSLATGSETNKIKLSISDDAPLTDDISAENQQDISDSSTQKKKKKKKNKDKKTPESEDVIVAEGSHKKKKNKSDANTTDTSKTVVPETESIGFTVETHVPEIYNSVDADVVTGKKRKRKSTMTTAEELEGLSSSFLATGSEAKKIKLAITDNAPLTDDISAENQQDISDSSTQKKKKKKKNKDKKTPESEDVIVAGDLEQNTETTDVQNTISSKKKKKKKHAISSNETKDTSFTKMNKETNSVAETDMFETELEALLTTLPTDASSGAQGTSKTDTNSAAGEETKLANSDNAPDDISPENQQDISDSTTQKKKKKKKNKDKKTPESEDVNVADETKQSKKNRKRKERDDDEEQNQAKLLKESHETNIHVPRLPISLLQKLEVNSKPNRAPNKKKIVSTTNFEIDEGHVRRKNKPSYYLEESVYLDADTPDKKKTVAKINKSKVLPFMPTASTSSYGFTSNCKVNVVPTETKFLAQTSNIANFKNDYLYGKNIKRLGTYELYKKQRTLKLSKF